MTKKDIARSIADVSGVPHVRVARAVQGVFEGIVEALAQQGRIELRNFGVFEVRRRKARRARNPRTGERLSVPERLVVTFKPGREMEERVKGLTGVPGRGNRSRVAGDKRIER